MELTEGAIFGGDYRVVRPLAEGGMGAVWVVEQISTAKPRALKLMKKELAANDAMRARFEQEARIGARIASEHVVEVVAAGVDRGTPYLVMELLQGELLVEHVARRGALPVLDVVAILRQLCHAVGAAHDAGVVHRDLKPENIFLAHSQRADTAFTVKVLDFGIAKLLAEGNAKETAALGTPVWLAPEQTERAPVTAAADVWAIALIAFHLLTGRYFWRSLEDGEAGLARLLREVVLDPVPKASVRAGEMQLALPEGFDDWFARCVVRDASQRWPNAREAYAALAAVMGVSSLGQTPVGLSSPSAMPVPNARTPLSSTPGRTPAPVESLASAPTQADEALLASAPTALGDALTASAPERSVVVRASTPSDAASSAPLERAPASPEVALSGWDRAVPFAPLIVGGLWVFGAGYRNTSLEKLILEAGDSIFVVIGIAVVGVVLVALQRSPRWAALLSGAMGTLAMYAGWAMVRTGVVRAPDQAFSLVHRGILEASVNTFAGTAFTACLLIADVLGSRANRSRARGVRDIASTTVGAACAVASFHVRVAARTHAALLNDGLTRAGRAVELAKEPPVPFVVAVSFVTLLVVIAGILVLRKLPGTLSLRSFSWRDYAFVVGALAWGVAALRLERTLDHATRAVDYALLPQLELPDGLDPPTALGLPEPPLAPTLKVTRDHVFIGTELQGLVSTLEAGALDDAVARGLTRALAEAPGKTDPRLLVMADRALPGRALVAALRVARTAGVERVGVVYTRSEAPVVVPGDPVGACLLVPSDLGMVNVGLDPCPAVALSDWVATLRGSSSVCVGGADVEGARPGSTSRTELAPHRVLDEARLDSIVARELVDRLAGAVALDDDVDPDGVSPVGRRRLCAVARSGPVAERVLLRKLEVGHASRFVSLGGDLVAGSSVRAE